jgi:hypothetical protein
MDVCALPPPLVTSLPSPHPVVTISNTLESNLQKSICRKGVKERTLGIHENFTKLESRDLPKMIINKKVRRIAYIHQYPS